MKKRAIAAMATPAVAVVAVVGVLVATHHTTVPPLTPSSSPSAASGQHGAAGARPAVSGPCEHVSLAGPAGRRPFLGIATNPELTGHVKSFQAATGARMQIVEYYDAFDRPFQKWEAAQAVAAGAVPLIQLNPRGISLSQIAGGSYDDHIRQYARAVRAFGCPVMLSFGHEMNGWWYSWARPDTTPAAFIAAWRHIFDIFRAQHVTNATWSWDPTHQYKGRASFASQWFPGNAYVNWVGIDGYLGAGQNFADVFAVQLRDIRRVTNKPVFLAETGVGSDPRQGWQIANLFAALTTYHLAGLVWFDLNGREPWRLQGRPAALAAYRRATASLR